MESIARADFDWPEATRLLSGLGSQSDIDEDRKREPYATFLQPSEQTDSLGRFARFEVTEILGRGGMGIVLRAHDTALQRDCAIKVLAPELASSAAARKRFSREARSAAAVVHPHVVPIQTVDEHGGLPYLVMPVVNGQSLQQRIETEGPLSIIETVRIASQVADGLAAAHAQGLVHRDIKPANILLENGVERVQITDFGLARAIDDASMTRSGVIAGTPQYMSPEQAHGDAIDHRSDLFSLGSVMYFMLTGRSPFRAETTMGVLNRIGNDQPRSLRSINADVPDWLEAIVMKLLSKSRDDRFESASDVAELLQGWHAHLQSPDTAVRPNNVVDESTSPVALDRLDSSPRPLPSAPRTQPINRWLVALAAFAFFAFAGIIIYLETGKGTLRIESNSEADVPIAIRQGDKIVEHLTVSRDGDDNATKSWQVRFANRRC
ncbi:MAG: serine/threonine-protein kinase [Pirellulaceae bacterium]